MLWPCSSITRCPSSARGRLWFRRTTKCKSNRFVIFPPPLKTSPTICSHVGGSLRKIRHRIALTSTPELFAEEQRLNGAIILHMLGAFYFFTLLAVVCNDYFLPTIECICEDLKISPVGFLLLDFFYQRQHFLNCPPPSLSRMWQRPLLWLFLERFQSSLRT